MKPKKNILAAIFALTVLIWGCYAFKSGIVMSPDSYKYAKWADALIASNFNIINFQNTIETFPTFFLYVGFIFFVAVTKIIAGLFWQQLIVIINVVLGALLAVMLADLVYIFTRSKLSVWIVFILYTLNPEIILWSRYILSDISYMFLNSLIFYFIARVFLAKDGHGGRYWRITLFVFLVSIFYRPTSIVMVPVILFAFYLYNRKKDIELKPLFVFLVPLILVTMLIYAAVIKDIWSLHPGKSVLRDLAVSLYQKGIVMHDRPHTYHNAPTALLDYFFITADKFVHYFCFSDKLFSPIHKLINSLIFIPLYALFVLGIRAVAGKKNNLVARSLVALAVIVIAAYGLFHSVTLIDFDWRYRLPILPYILFISGLGVKFLIQTYKGKDDVGV